MQSTSKPVSTGLPLLLCFLAVPWSSPVWTSVPGSVGSARETRAAGLSEAHTVLVTRDGERIAVEGSWERRGRRVIFTDDKGRLSSIAAEAIDFEATARAAEPAPEAPTPAPVETTQKPVLVLDASNTPTFERAPRPAPAEAGRVEGTTTRTRRVSRSEDDSEESTKSDSSASGPATEAEDSSRRNRGIEVVSWQDLGTEENTAIWGSIQNLSGLPAAEISIELRLVAQDGSLIAKDMAVPDNPRLLPGEKSNFNLQLPGRVEYHDIEFEISYDELRPRGQ